MSILLEFGRMSTFRFLIAMLACAAFIASCHPKAEPVPMEELELKEDKIRKFAIKVPKNWVTQHRSGDIIASFTSKPHAARFTQFGKGVGGAKIEIRAIALDSNTTLDSLVERSKLEFENPDERNRYRPSVATLGGKPARKLYVEFDQEDGKFVSESYFAENDSVVTMVTFSAFGNTFQDYEEDFKKILGSVKLAQKLEPQASNAQQPVGSVPPPSDTLKPHNGGSYSFSYPKNFEMQPGSGGAISSTIFVGARRDCSIQIDVIDAKEQNNLDRIVEQNKSRYPGSAQSATTLGGQRAVVFNYNPTAAIAARAYFAVNGDKMYRVTVNWNKAEQQVYLPVFEKCLRTIRLN